MQTIILLSTQTSATGSIWRIIEKITDSKIIKIGFDLDKKEKIGEYLNEIPKTDHIVLHNRPDLLRMLKNKEDYKYIVNFRDPRDRLCNKFHWMQQHPHFPGEPKADIQKRGNILKEKGINSWLHNELKPEYEKELLLFLNSIPKNNMCVATYAKLCLEFDFFVKEIAKFLGVSLTKEHWNSVDNERVETISKNPKWIGKIWTGGDDIMPGRYKSEVDNETIHLLNLCYREVLYEMAKIDTDFSSLYLEGVPEKKELKTLLGFTSTELASPDIMRDKAIDYESKGNFKIAEMLMEHAFSLRPQGPVIRKKLLEYLKINNRAS